MAIDDDIARPDDAGSIQGLRFTDRLRERSASAWKASFADGFQIGLASQLPLAATACRWRRQIVAWVIKPTNAARRCLSLAQQQHITGVDRHRVHEIALQAAALDAIANPKLLDLLAPANEHSTPKQFLK
jgi:hypothetical protein